MSPLLLPRRLLATQSDERLVALARVGHERAFEALVDRYRKPLLRYCRRLLLPEARAEDALQQAWISAWQALSRGVDVGDPRAWLYRIVHNQAVSVLRKSGYDYAELSESLAGADAPENDLERRIAVREALAGLASLPELQREVLLRTAVEGESHEQVARALGLTDGAVRGMIYRARATLRTAATALTPSPVAAWAASAGRSAAPLTQRLAESVGLGSAGVTGALVKTGAVALTAGSLVTGSVLVHAGHHPGRTAAASAAARPAGGGGGPGVAGANASALDPIAPSQAPSDGTSGSGHDGGVRSGRRRGSGRELAVGPGTGRREHRSDPAVTGADGQAGPARSPSELVGDRGGGRGGHGGEHSSDGRGGGGSGSNGGGGSGGRDSSGGGSSGGGGSVEGSSGGGGSSGDGGSSPSSGSGGGSGRSGGGGTDGGGGGPGPSIAQTSAGSSGSDGGSGGSGDGGSTSTLNLSSGGSGGDGSTRSGGDVSTSTDGSTTSGSGGSSGH